MCRIVDERDYGTHGQGVDAQHERALAHGLQHVERDVAAPYGDERQQRAVYAEHRAGGAGADARIVPPAADHAAGQRRQQVDDRKTRAAEQLLGKHTAVVQRIHVEPQVDGTEMDEGGGQETPGLTIPGEGTVVRAEVHVYPGVEGHEAGAGRSMTRNNVTLMPMMAGVTG